MFRQSEFLRDFREKTAAATRGCILLERPDLLSELVTAHQARDSSGREDGLAVLRRMEVCASHDMGDAAIPEKQWMYRFAKKHWFFGFGAYG